MTTGRSSIVGAALAVAAATGCLVGCSDGSGTSAPGSPPPSGGAAPASTAPPSSPPPSAPGLDLDRFLSDSLGDRPGGVVALVVKDGTATWGAAGIADADGDPITPTTEFRVGSVTKPFVATMILQLVDEGRVDLDQPLSSYLPATSVGGDVTVRELLSHHSGIPDFLAVDAARKTIYSHLRRAFTPDEMLAYAATVPAFSPGGRFGYSNTNYLLLGQLVEHLDGTDLGTSLHRRILDPLRLHHTVLATAEDPSPDGVAGAWSPYLDLDGEPDTAYTSIASMAWAAGALVSTADDLHTFLAALFAGDLISDRSLQEMTTIGTRGEGLGLFVTGGEERRYGHDGLIDGYTAAMDIEPVSGDSIVVLTNDEQISAPNLLRKILARS